MEIYFYEFSDVFLVYLQRRIYEEEPHTHLLSYHIE